MYHPGETEVLAVVHASTPWRCCLEGNLDVNEDTNHNLLIWLQMQPNLSPKQVRWVIYLQRFPFRWKYLPDRINVANPILRAPQLKGSQAEPVAAVLHVVQSSASQSDQLFNGTSNSEAPLTDFEKSCVTQYANNSWFLDESNLFSSTSSRGWYHKDSRLIVLDAHGLWQTCLYHVHTSP